MDTIENDKPQKKTYTEAQKKATKKYRDNNREKVNEQRKKYYLERVKNDPEFVEYKRNKAREYYHRKKAQKVEPIKAEEELSQELPEDVIEQLIGPKIEDVKEQKEDLKLDIKPVRKPRGKASLKFPIVPTSEVSEEKLLTSEVSEEKIETPNITPIAVRKNRIKK